MEIYEHVKGHISVPMETSDGNYETIEIDFDENDIIKDSCSITSRCCDDSTFSFGGVNPAELSIKLKLYNEKINAYNLYGAKIKLWSCYTETAESEKEWILRGEFWVTSVSRIKDIYTIKANDALVWMNTSCYTTSNKEKDYKKDDRTPLYDALVSSASDLGNSFNKVINYINELLKENEIEKIEISNEHTISVNMKESGAFIRDDAQNISYSPIDYLKEIGEISAGCCQMITDTQDTSKRKLLLSSLGFPPENAEISNIEEVKKEWETIEIPYAIIAQDSCDIANWCIFYQRVYAKTYDETGWWNCYAWNKFQGNVVLDLTGNTFIDGFLYGNNAYGEEENSSKMWRIIQSAHDHINKTEKRPFKLKCYKVFKTLYEYPKLGQKIRIEEKPGQWRGSIITKMIWKFRGGWEFGCAGSDSRVLSQAAKKSLASHAEQKAKAYASNINEKAINAANEAQKEAQETWIDAYNWNIDRVNDLDNINLDISGIKGDISNLWDAINSL